MEVYHIKLVHNRKEIHVDYQRLDLAHPTHLSGGYQDLITEFYGLSTFTQQPIKPQPPACLTSFPGFAERDCFTLQRIFSTFLNVGHCDPSAQSWRFILMIVVDLTLRAQQAVWHVMSLLSSTKRRIIWQWEMTTREQPDKAQTLLDATQDCSVRRRRQPRVEVWVWKLSPCYEEPSVCRCHRYSKAPFFPFGEHCWCDALHPTLQVRRTQQKINGGKEVEVPATPSKRGALGRG